jgi:TIR domain
MVSNVVISPLFRSEPRSGPGPKSMDLPEEEDPPAFWKPGCFRAFISHVSASKVAAHRLKEALARYQIAAFVAHDNVEPTKEWQSEIESALRTMDALVAMITPGFLESRWCDQEVGFALGRGKLVVSLRIDADPHGFLARSQGLQAKGLLPAAVAERLSTRLFAVDQHTVSGFNPRPPYGGRPSAA